MQSFNFEDLKPAYGNVVVHYKQINFPCIYIKGGAAILLIISSKMYKQTNEFTDICQLASLNRFIICESRKAIFLLTRLKEIIPCSEESTFFLS